MRTISNRFHRPTSCVIVPIVLRCRRTLFFVCLVEDSIWMGRINFEGGTGHGLVKPTLTYTKTDMGWGKLNRILTNENNRDEQTG
jgi:hypothetical protein